MRCRRHWQHAATRGTSHASSCSHVVVQAQTEFPSDPRSLPVRKCGEQHCAARTEGLQLTFDLSIFACRFFSQVDTLNFIHKPSSTRKCWQEKALCRQNSRLTSLLEQVKVTQQAEKHNPIRTIKLQKSHMYPVKVALLRTEASLLF